MSSIEHTFTAVPNALFSSLVKVSFSPYEWRVILCVWRKTWGYQRNGCYTSYRDLADLTHIDVRHVHRTVLGLCEKNVLWKKTTSKGTYMQFNSDAALWVLPEKDDDRQLKLRLGPMAVKALPQEARDMQRSVASRGNASVAAGGTLLKKKESTKEREEVLPQEARFRLFG